MAAVPLQSLDYAAVPQKDSDEETIQQHAPTTRYSRLTWTPWVLHILLIAVNIFTFWYLTHRQPGELACAKLLSPWSPAFDHSAVHYEKIPIAGFHNDENQYIGVPTPEIDQTWRNISTDVPLLLLSEEDLARLKKPPASVARLPADRKPGYLGTLEVYELLACLDRLRKASYRDHYPELKGGYEGFDERQWQAELDYCVDTLRTELMCAADVSVLPLDKTSMNVRHDLRPNFAAAKKCRSFSQILAWSHENKYKVTHEYILKSIPGAS